MPGHMPGHAKRQDRTEKRKQTKPQPHTQNQSSPAAKQSNGVANSIPTPIYKRWEVHLRDGVRVYPHRADGDVGKVTVVLHTLARPNMQPKATNTKQQEKRADRQTDKRTDKNERKQRKRRKKKTGERGRRKRDKKKVGENRPPRV